MTWFIWTAIGLWSGSIISACVNIARGQQPSMMDRAIGAAIELFLVIWGVYVVTKGIA